MPWADEIEEVPESSKVSQNKVNNKNDEWRKIEIILWDPKRPSTRSPGKS